MSLSWGRSAGKSELRAVLHVALAGLATTDAARVVLRAVPERQPGDQHSPAPDAEVVSSTPMLEPTDDDLATTIRIAVPFAELFARGAGKWTFVLDLEISGSHYRLPLAAETLLPQAYRWGRGRTFRISSRATKSGRLQLVVQPVARRRAVVQQLRSLVTRAERE
jgi:hypothetical protein